MIGALLLVPVVLCGVSVALVATGATVAALPFTVAAVALVAGIAKASWNS